MEVEFCPQGTLASECEREAREFPAFTRGPAWAPWLPKAKSTRSSTGSTYILERGIQADVALVKAWKADLHGNLVYRRTARNFNPNAATCGKITVAEAEMIVEPGELDPDEIHTPGIFVHRAGA